MSRAHHTHAGVAIEVRRTAGAVVTRIMHPPQQRIDAHCHDWPVLSLYRIGGYCEENEEGRVVLNGPSVVFHPAGAGHADDVSDAGLETVSMSFDPAWLDAGMLPRKSLCRAGGEAGFAARALSRLWLSPGTNDDVLRRATARFLAQVFSMSDGAASKPVWLERVDAALAAEARHARALAPELARHPAWVARAYRAYRGEGIRETIRRWRVEGAMNCLRFSAQSLASVAAACGFADQSHMCRCFQAVLGRSPLEVRREAALLMTLM